MEMKKNLELKRYLMRKEKQREKNRKQIIRLETGYVNKMVEQETPDSSSQRSTDTKIQR